MDNLFNENRKKNWIKFFENDRVMLTEALVMCETGIVKPKGYPNPDCTNEPLWQKITGEQNGRR